MTPGLANRLCARVADLILLTYEQTAGRLPDLPLVRRSVVPSIPKVLTGDKNAAAKRYGLDAERPTLLVVGDPWGCHNQPTLPFACARSLDRQVSKS